MSRSAIAMVIGSGLLLVTLTAPVAAQGPIEIRATAPEKPQQLRIVEPSAKFRLPEVALGILASWGGTQRLVRLLGPARAKEVILLREQVNAGEAARNALRIARVGQYRRHPIEQAETSIELS